MLYIITYYNTYYLYVHVTYYYFFISVYILSEFPGTETAQGFMKKILW